MGQKHYTLETWKEKATKVHNGKYTYERITEYKNGKQKGEIYCTICKEYFVQTLKEHINGSGHRKCSAKNSYWVNVEPLIEKFRKVHGNKYDYSKFVYKGFHNKSTIICPIHGEFEQAPSKHTNDRGCPKCGDDRIKQKQRKPKEKFIREIEERFPNKFKFDKLEYKGDRTEVTLYCNDCKEYHTYIPNYLLSKSGCGYCRARNEIRTFEDFYERLSKEQKENYIYYPETFINSNSNMKVTHKECGHTYYQRPNHITLRNTGCPYCCESGFKKDKDSILYYLKVKHNNHYFYKIGITNNTVKDRYFNRDLEKVKDYVTFPMIGQKAWDWEKAIITKYKDELYQGNEIILDSAKGNKELFNKDILGVFNVN